MNVLNEFTIPLQGIKNGLHEFEFQIGKSFFQHFETSPIKVGKVAVQLNFEKQSDHSVMDFQFNGFVDTECDRCLETFSFPLNHNYQLLLKVGLEEKEEADIIYILDGTKEFNVAKYIYELICLSLPLSKSHEDAGQNCDEEMIKYIKNENSTAKSEEKTKGSIWDELKKFNKN